MKSSKIACTLSMLIMCFIFLTSFREQPKPHLIVGLWAITEETTLTWANEKNNISQLYFGSDEISSDFIFTDKKELHLAYRIYENLDGYKKPVIYFINTSDKNFKLAFTIEKLTKDSLELKCIKAITSKAILPNKETLVFERIAGPPENMSDSESTLHIETKRNKNTKS